MKPINQHPVKAIHTQTLILVISAERFGTYLKAAGHDQERALRLYLWNAQLGEAFHLPIQAVEVGLRNRINDVLIAKFGANWWNDQRFTSLIDHERIADLELVKRRITRRSLPLATGQIVAGLSFGFWVGLLQAQYNPAIWSAHLRTGFPDLPKDKTRNDLAAKAGKVAFLRNRISHHEPLIRRNISIDYADIRTLIQWLCPSKWEWINPHCRVPEIMRLKP